ncbi:xanthine dehydrogenase family protein subunit M [soil metagenome]
MKPSAFAYHAPTTLDQALQLAATLDNAKLLAGGQTLMPMMNFRFVQPDHVIDLNTVPELQGIDLLPGKLRIGSMTRQRDIERSELVQRVAPLIPEAYSLVSHPQIRNRGTLGGSLCHLDPASEQPCFLAAQGATLVVRGPRGERRVPIADWPQGYMTPNLEPDEVLSGIECDIWPQGHGWSFTEYSRRSGDYAIVGVAVLVACDVQRRITRLAVALCGIAAGPVRLLDAEAATVGRPADDAVIETLQSAARSLDTMSDAHVSADYRKHLAGVLTGRALRGAFARMKAMP